MNKTNPRLAELQTLREENASLRRDNAALLTANQQLQEQLTALQAQLSQLQKATNPVKPARHKKERTPRAERARQHNHARRREEVSPDQIVEHRLVSCPDCGMELHHYKLSHRHQVIDIPPPPPPCIVEHQVYKGYCYHCQRWHSAQSELASKVVGKARLGPRLSAWLGWLRTSLHLPIRKIQSYLQVGYGLRLSVGGISQLLERLVAAGADELAGIKERIKQRAVVHADETGWREDGSNGYAWGLFTPKANATLSG